MFARLLRIVGWGWIWVAATVIIVSYASLWYRNGFVAVAEMLSGPVEQPASWTRGGQVAANSATATKRIGIRSGWRWARLERGWGRGQRALKIERRAAASRLRLIAAAVR
jgi:hypothetical protein